MVDGLAVTRLLVTEVGRKKYSSQVVGQPHTNLAVIVDEQDVGWKKEMRDIQRPEVAAREVGSMGCGSEVVEIQWDMVVEILAAPEGTGRHCSEVGHLDLSIRFYTGENRSFRTYLEYSIFVVDTLVEGH